MTDCYRYLTLGWLLLLTTAGWTQSPGTNYSLSRTYKQANIAENFTATNFAGNSAQATTQVTYFDGLGKPTQQVMAFQAASKGDLVTLTEYDELHRPVRTFLPAPFTTNGGLLQQPGDIKAKAETYYKDGAKVSAALAGNAPPEALAAQTAYEQTPLSRVTAQKAPGAANGVSQAHGVNSLNEVKQYQITGTGLTSVQLQGSYDAGALSWVKTTDENEQVVTEYQDRYGRVVLKRVKLTQDINLDTYYVYDEKGQLRAVLQPKYQQLDGNTLEQSAFLYRYDDLGRLVEKKVPGANAQQMTYKLTTELLETLTDGKGTVFYYKYDPQNRQIEMGVKPGGTETPLLYTYYDSYAFGPFLGFTNEFNLMGSEFVDNNTAQVERKGLMTGSKARVLKPDGQFGDWLQTVIYYDNKYRVIQTLRQLYGFSSAAHERVSYKLAFDGKPEVEWTTQVTGSVSYKLTKAYTYDHANRLIKTDHELFEGGVSKKQYTHVEQVYNELGQLAAKSLHGGIQILNDKYTPRGWLGNHQTSVGQPFSLGLAYQDNGNITSQSWTTKTYNGGMNLGYDKASRLTGATGTGGFANYDESPIQYDANGNITNLTRKYSNTVIDQLAYQYHGNQLHRVNDDNNNEGQAVKGFVNGASADNELAYDANGNLTKDDNRGISAISYNVLNLSAKVSRVVAGTTRTVQYTYDGVGTKHKSEAPDNVNTFYAGAFEYRADNNLLRIGLEEGQLVKDGSNYIVHYYLRDHLGNVRSVMDESGTIIQETEYYAFGLPVQRNGSDKNKYLYNGKEKQPETEWLDYGARMYDPSIGRMNQIDGASELFTDVSPYVYGLNNPLIYIDPSGDTTIHYSDLAANWKGFNPQQDDVQLSEVTVKTQRNDDSQAKGTITDEQVTELQHDLKENLIGIGKFILGIPEQTDPNIQNATVPLPFFMGGGAAKGASSLGAGRTGVKQWLQNVGNLERGTLIQNIEAAGFKRMSPVTSPVSVFERGGMRIRLDPPQSGTPFNHMHLELGRKKSLTSYDIFLNQVPYDAPSAHIPIR